MKNSVNKNVPILRFPEFENEPAWEEKKLGDVSDVRDGTHDSPKFYDNGKPLITSKNLLKNGLLNLNNVKFISNEDYQHINNRSKVDIGDILFGMIGTIGNPVMVNSNEFAIKNVALIKQQNLLLNNYLVHFLNSQYIKTSINALLTGNTQKFISLGNLRNIKIPSPNLKEQQKIADCLTSLDDLITAQSQKVDSLKQHKKGLMQQLFPQADTNLPKLRFPAFKNAPVWEEKKLEDVADRYDNLRVPVTTIDRVSGCTPYYGANGIQDYVKGYTHDGEFILIAEDGANDLKNYPVQYVNGKIWVNNHAHVLQSKKDIANNHFLKFIISQTNIEPFLVGGGRAKLNAGIMMKIKIPLPKLPEQQKIADCLTSLDELINAQSQKVLSLKQHKKGLMQKLFPEN